MNPFGAPDSDPARCEATANEPHRSAALRFMESSLFLTDLLTGHEPEKPKSLEINGGISRFMGRWCEAP